MKNFLKSIVMLLAIVIIFNSNLTGAEASDFEELPRFYDANDNEIFPYTKDELLEYNQSTISMNTQSEKAVEIEDYFGYAKFSNFVWIRDGKTYKNPLYISVEKITRTTGHAVYYYDSANNYEGKAVFPKYGNLWHIAPAEHLQRGKSYKFKFVSESGETAEVKQGMVVYTN